MSDPMKLSISELRDKLRYVDYYSADLPLGWSRADVIERISELESELIR